MASSGSRSVALIMKRTGAAALAEGHSAGALAGVGEDTLLLKMVGRIAGAEINAENLRARVSAATKSHGVSSLASPHGLTALSGSSAEVGVVGYKLGGDGDRALSRGLALASVIPPSAKGSPAPIEVASRFVANHSLGNAGAVA